MLLLALFVGLVIGAQAGVEDCACKYTEPMVAGDSLADGECACSGDGVMKLLNNQGQLELYSVPEGVPPLLLWQSIPEVGDAGAIASMTEAGAFEVTDSAGTIPFSTGTTGATNKAIVMDNGNFAILDSLQEHAWDSNSFAPFPCHQEAAPIEFPDPTLDKFEFTMTVGFRKTMIDYNHHHQAIYYNIDDHKFFSRFAGFPTQCGDHDLKDVSCAQVRESHDKSGFRMGDGTHRKITHVNNAYPGPPIVVNQGAEVTVKVFNNLYMLGFTLHFHGVDQVGTWWSDGIAGLQQCVIPYQSWYEYKFTAANAGTFWYHGHLGTDRGEGLYGPFIVVPKDESEANPQNNEFIKIDETGTVVSPDKQYIVHAEDWFTMDATHAMDHLAGHTFKIMDMIDDPYATDKCYFPSKTEDKTVASPIPVQSIIVNGRGWTNLDDLATRPSELPLEMYRVKQGEYYLFRFINAGITARFQFALPGHKMIAVATDGRPIEPVEVDEIMVFPGERYDVAIKADQAPGTYYLRMANLGTRNFFFKEREEGRDFAVAVIQYDGVHPSNAAPRTTACDDKSADCLVLNCPWSHFGPDAKANCVQLDDLRSLNPPKHPESLQADYTDSDEDFQEFIFNIVNTDRVNGYRYTYPYAPPYLYQNNDANLDAVMPPCNPDKRCYSNTDTDCVCSLYVNIRTNATVQMTFMNQGRYSGHNHPIHMHGHHFHVVKQGWGNWDENGYHAGGNMDLGCGSGDDCVDPAWADPEWSNGRVPGLQLDNPISKDTVLLPAGSYIVTRFKADNPGWWIIHCHIMIHHGLGMAWAMKVGEYSEMSMPPWEQPSCGHFMEGSKWENGQWA